MLGAQSKSEVFLVIGIFTILLIIFLITKLLPSCKGAWKQA